MCDDVLTHTQNNNKITKKPKDDVAQRSDAVNAKLQKRRQHTEELGHVQALLAKLQTVFDLPRRMRAALEQGALGASVAYYAEALPLLQREAWVLQRRPQRHVYFAIGIVALMRRVRDALSLLQEALLGALLFGPSLPRLA